MVSQSVNTHLSREEIIKSGSFYTGPELVELVYNQIAKYISKDTIIGDFGSGYGSFIEKFKDCGKKCFGTEYNDLSFQLLEKEYPTINFYHENSLLNVNREKYGLTDTDKLIIVGNPPYNDTTSIFKKGEKGKLVCDSDLASRDFGISFLKAYNKLRAEYVCILHPLAYLIKKQNFNALGNFKDNYKLLSATIFSSKEFESIKKTNSDFPVVSALYKRDSNGITYEDIKNFKFSIYRSNKKFILSNILTIDGLVNKYPTNHKKDNSINQINLLDTISNANTHRLQFYTLRDMNALLRNASFVEGIIPNGIDVTLENLYQYSWLYFLKTNFNPSKNKFLYGNLSPLYTKKIEEDSFKNEAVYYAYNNNPLVKKYINEDTIKALYGPNINQYNALFTELNKLSELFN